MSDRDPTIEAMLDAYCPPSFEPGAWQQVLQDAAPTLDGSGGARARLHSAARWLGWRGRLIVLGGSLTVAAGAALAITSPWRGGPTILERAAAAIAGPSAAQVLFENIVVRSAHAGAAGIHVRVWLDGSAPYRFRIVSDARSAAGSGATADQLDVGGTLGDADGLSYGAADGVLDPVAFQWRFLQGSLDPVDFVRTALTSSRGCPRASCAAQLDGQTTISGRAVIRILLTYRAPAHAATNVLYFVDARTFKPVRVILSSGGTLPQTSVLTIRYLPPTRANLKLTNLQAQHPRARIN